MMHFLYPYGIKSDLSGLGDPDTVPDTLGILIDDVIVAQIDFILPYNIGQDILHVVGYRFQSTIVGDPEELPLEAVTELCAIGMQVTSLLRHIFEFSGDRAYRPDSQVSDKGVSEWLFTT